jgi:hypothetical protein
MLNTAPNSWQLLDLLAHCDEGPKAIINGVSVPARPYGFYSLSERCRLAWAVFTGRADALFWHGSMPKAY